MSKKKGTLTIVGTGIRAISHLTNEARVHMERADILFYLVADPLTRNWIESLGNATISLMHHYVEGMPRLDSYTNMIKEIMKHVQDGGDVCCAFYGHPSVFVYPSHELVRLCRDDGIVCEVCPSISADACLYADLSIDPAKNGLASYEATDFLVFDRPASPACGLVLWQIGVIGDLGYHKHRDVRHGLSVLTNKLVSIYPNDHHCFVYEAATLPIMSARIQEVMLGQLASANVTAISTLYLPPSCRPELNAAMLKALGLSIGDLKANSTLFQRRNP